jgi:hypothetical protein
MKRQRYVLSALLLFFLVVSPMSRAPKTLRGRMKENPLSKAKAEILTSTFAFRAESREKIERDPNVRVERALPGQPDRRASPDLRAPAGPSGPSGGQVLGMDPTIALLVGLGVLAVVIVAIVAASRGGEH